MDFYIILLNINNQHFQLMHVINKKKIFLSIKLIRFKLTKILFFILLLKKIIIE